MRSGPSARMTSCRARRQRKRIGGPSGTSAKMSVMGSGLASRRSGRALNPAARRQRRLEAAREPLDAREHVLLARDRLVKAFLRHIRRDRQTRAQRLVFAAERAIELAQEIGAEAGGERRARQTENVADAFQADARQRGDRLLRQPKRWERQWRKTFARIETCIAWRPDFAEARQRGGCADRGGDGGARRKAPPCHSREDIVAKVLLAAEEMRAAADVEQNAVGRIEGDERRVALAGLRNSVEKTGVGGRICRHGRERRMHGARLRQREADREAEPLRFGIDCEQEIEIAALAEDDEGTLPACGER